MIVAESKVCSKCGENKPLDEFHSQPHGVGGKTSKCAKCCSIDRKARYKAIKDGSFIVGSGPPGPKRRVDTIEELREKLRDCSISEPNSGCWLWERRTSSQSLQNSM
jgi:hypothetical protein